MNKIDILYATDQNYLTMTLASILSLSENSNLTTSERIDVHLMTEDITEEDRNKIELVNSLCPNINLFTYPLEEFHIERYGIPEWQNTQVANARLFFQKILKEQVEKMDRMLYLDSDTIILGDLSGLLNKEAPIYAVRDNTPSSYAKGLGLYTYYNSGVLYIDVKKWLEENYQEQIENYIENNQGKKFTYPDQDILNVVLQGQITELSREYNMAPYAYALRDEKLTNYCKRYNVPLDELLLARNNPKILHSTGLLGIKPWMINKIHPYNEPYREYISQVDPNFNLQIPRTIKGALAQYPSLFYTLFELKYNLPETLDPCFRKLSIQLNPNQKVKKRKDKR